MIDPFIIAKARAVRIEEEIKRRGIRLRRIGRGEFEGLCPVCGGTNRFSINTRKQFWHCRQCKPGGIGGKVVDLVLHLDGIEFLQAVAMLAGEGWDDAPVRPAPRREPIAPAPNKAPTDDDNSGRALPLWRSPLTSPISGTIAETYLWSRGLEYDDPAGEVLRFHPRCPFGSAVQPCMIALFRTIEGDKPIAIHRTALTPDAKKIDRRPFGFIAGAAIKLSTDEIVTMGLHIGEGTETTLAAMARDFHPAWALGSAGGIAKFPILSGIESLTLIVDNDQASRAAARECGDPWREAGREVVLIVPRRHGADMADILASEVRHAS